MHSIVWINTAVAATALVGLTSVLVWWGGKRRPSKRLPQEWPLMQRPVFSWEERALYRQLRAALPNHTVLAKLPLVRFCQPIEREDLRYWFELLGPIHVSFVVCASNGRALAAIDIDQPTRQVSERTMAIKQAVLEACHIRYVKCRSDQLPSIAELQLLVPSQGEQARPQVPSPFTGVEQHSTLAHTVRSPRRTPIDNHWKESGFASDSFFAHDKSQRDLNDELGGGASPEPESDSPFISRTPVAAAPRQRPAPATTPLRSERQPPASSAEREQQALREELRRGIRQDLRREEVAPRPAAPAPAPAPLDLRLDPLLKPPVPADPRRAPVARPAAVPQTSGFGPNIMPLHRTGPGPNKVAGTLAEDMIGRDFGAAPSAAGKPRKSDPASEASGDGGNIIGRP